VQHVVCTEVCSLHETQTYNTPKYIISLFAYHPRVDVARTCMDFAMGFAVIVATVCIFNIISKAWAKACARFTNWLGLRWSVPRCSVTANMCGVLVLAAGRSFLLDFGCRGFGTLWARPLAHM